MKMFHFIMFHYLMFHYLILHCLMLHYSLLLCLRLHDFNAILFRISLLLLHYFNASVSDVVFFEFTLFIIALYNVALMLHYVNVALYYVPLF